MKQKRHCENVRSATAARNIACIGAILADLTLAVQTLDRDVGIEEERFRIRDRSDARYPMLARTLLARRDNLKATIAELETRLSSIAPSLELAVA